MVFLFRESFQANEMQASGPIADHNLSNGGNYDMSSIRPR